MAEQTPPIILPGRTSFASAQGHRPSQEDRYLCSPVVTATRTGLLMVVLDGHGGSTTVDALRKSLPTTFLRHLAAPGGTVEEVLQSVVASLAAGVRDEDSGSTLTAAWVTEAGNHATIAVLGDSPVVVRVAGGLIHVGPEHNVRTNLAEQQTAIGRGAIYSSGYLRDPRSGHGLQMSRALGDRALDRFLNPVPEIYDLPLDGQSWILLASDGLVDPAHLANEAVIKKIGERIEWGCDAEDLVALAIGEQAWDNVTAVLWRATLSKE